MTSGDVLGAIFDPNSPWLVSSSFLLTILKWMTLVGFGMYVIFAFAIIRQVAMMTKTIQTGLGFPLKIVAWGHFFFAIIVWLIAFFRL